MTEPNTPDDQLLSEALRAEVEGVEASPALLERTRTAIARPPRHTGRWLVAAAAVIVTVGIVATLAVGDDTQDIDSVQDPTSTTSTTEAPTPDPVDILTVLPLQVACHSGESVDFALFAAPGTPAATVQALGDSVAADPRVFGRRVVDASTIASRIAAEHDVQVPVEDVPPALVVDLMDPADETDVRSLLADQATVVAVSDVECLAAPEPAPRPTTIALVREDGMLALVDLGTGQQQELYTQGDPADDSQEGGPSFVDSVDLSPDGKWVYFSTCCEPAVGTTHRISTAGGEPMAIGQGSHPRVSPDGRHVATAGCGFVNVLPAEGGDGSVLDLGERCADSLAWSPDGRQLAAVSDPGIEGYVPEVLLYDWDGTRLTPADPGQSDNPGRFVAWSPMGVTTISAGGSVDRNRSLSQDASYQWLLWVDDQGVVREQAGLESGELPAIPGLPAALAADW